MPVFDQPHVKRGSFAPIQMEFPVFQFALVASCLLCVSCVSSEGKEEIISSSQNEIHFLEKLSKFASFLPAKSCSKLGWRCKVLVQGEKRDLLTDALPEAQKVKLPGVKAEIFTIESDEQPHGVLYRRDRRSHSIFFKQPLRKGCSWKCCLLMGKSAWGETTALPILQLCQGVKEGVLKSVRKCLFPHFHLSVQFLLSGVTAVQQKSVCDNAEQTTKVVKPRELDYCS